MAPNTPALRKKASGLCSACGSIQRQATYTMVSGASMPKMVGEYQKTKKQAINMQDLGNKISEMALADSKL